MTYAIVALLSMDYDLRYSHSVTAWTRCHASCGQYGHMVCKEQQRKSKQQNKL